MQAVADASPRVIGPFALPELSVRGAPLNYVIVANRQFLEVIPSLKVAMALLRESHPRRSVGRADLHGSVADDEKAVGAGVPDPEA